MNRTDKTALEPFLKRILQRSVLNQEERRAILSLGGETQKYAAHHDIVSPGQHVNSACLVARGLVARFDRMRDGNRQLTCFYIPGDMCDLHSMVAPKATWSITAISAAMVVRVPHRQLLDLCIRYPAIALAFWRDATVDASIFSKWVGNLGRKDAKARIAHLFCEMGVRMEAAGLGSRTLFDLQVTQEQIADAAGLTPVHVNRTLQDIRADGLLTFKGGRVEIHNWELLASIADFDEGFFLMLDV